MKWLRNIKVLEFTVRQLRVMSSLFSIFLLRQPTVNSWRPVKLLQLIRLLKSCKSAERKLNGKCISWQSGNVLTDHISRSPVQHQYQCREQQRTDTDTDMATSSDSNTVIAGCSRRHCSRKRSFGCPPVWSPIDASPQLFACPSFSLSPTTNRARMLLIYGIELLLGEFLFISMRVLRIMDACAGSASFEKGWICCQCVQGYADVYRYASIYLNIFI